MILALMVSSCIRPGQPTPTLPPPVNTEQGDIFRIPGDDRLIIPVESEREYAQSCPGPINASFLVSGAGSPVQYRPLQDGMRLITDFSSRSGVVHDCGQGLFTWAVLQSELSNGGYDFPKPQDFVLEFTGRFDYRVEDGASAVRSIVALMFWSIGTPYLIEISWLSENWGDRDPDPLYRMPAQSDALGVDYHQLDGEAWGLGFRPGESVDIVIDWYSVIQKLIEDGRFIEDPDFDDILTAGIMIGHEFFNASRFNSGWVEVQVGREAFPH